MVKYMKALQRSEDEKRRHESHFIQIREETKSINQWEAQLSKIIPWEGRKKISLPGH